MKEKKRKSKTHKKEKKKKYSSSSSSSSESDEWVEKSDQKVNVSERDDWMSMTGALKTFSKDDVRQKREEEKKKNIDSYNPATSARELNPYWKDGGKGLPQTSEEIRRTKYLKPSTSDDYYSRSHNHSQIDSKRDKNRQDTYESRAHYDRSSYVSSSNHKSGNWRKKTEEPVRQHESKANYDYSSYPSSSNSKSDNCKKKTEEPVQKQDSITFPVLPTKASVLSFPAKAEVATTIYLSDEKMNKLAAKIVKAEIMGDTNLVNELKTKLEAAREYRKQNRNASNDMVEDSIMLTSTNQFGNSRPLTKSTEANPRSKGNKRKADTHFGGERQKYFGDDDKYNLSQMFEQEKYGTNYDNDAQLAKIASKSKNPNDDLEDIFTDDVSKNRNEAQDDKKEREQAIRDHVKMQRSLEGCAYCLSSRNMVKHLIVSHGSRVYLSLPAKKSLVKGHCTITTIQHATCVTSIDEDVWEEIMDYRKALTRFFNSQDMDVVFYETASKLHKFPHMIINCVPLPRDVGDVASIYFKKAILDCEAEWALNKKVVDLRGKNIRKGIPKGLPYFWIDFGMDPGFAHVIEDQDLFPKHFAEEVIGGILDLDHSLWKNPQRERGDQQRKKVMEFIEEWKSFDTVENK